MPHCLGGPFINLIEDITVAGNRVGVKANAAFSRDHLRDDFYVEYMDDIGLDRMNETVALAPFILNVAQLVWIGDRDYEIDALDKDLAQSLEKIRPVFKTLYPRHGWEGRLQPRQLVDNVTKETTIDLGEETNLLFTGGVDSVLTSLQNYPRRQNLITVWGADVALDFEPKWLALRRSAESFAATYGHRNTFIKTNGKEIIRRKSIRPDIPVWWAYVQHGMGLTGLCIPVLYRGGAINLMISSSQWSGYDYPWGSLPDIDDRIRSAGITASHQGYDLTRQDKVNSIVAICDVKKLAPPKLNVCARPYASELNCEHCEKCLRTMTGIVVAGGDPRAFGFSCTTRDVWDRVRGSRESQALTMLRSELYLWLDIRENAEAALSRNGHVTDDDAQTFLHWLVDWDFETYSREFAYKHRWELRAKQWVSRYPALFELTKNVIERRRWFGY